MISEEDQKKLSAENDIFRAAIRELPQLLVEFGLIDQSAIDDPEDYDDGVIMGRVARVQKKMFPNAKLRGAL